MEIIVTDTEKIRNKLKDVGRLNESVLPGARRKAVKSGRARATRDIGLVLNLPGKRIRKQIIAERSRLYIEGLEREKPPTLASFRGKFLFNGRRSAGYQVTIWRGLGRKYIKPAFKIPKSNIPFIRTGPTREAPIRPMYGPRVGVVFNKIHIQLRNFMRDRISKEWQRAIRGRLSRA